MGLRLAARSNGVAKLHGDVSAARCSAACGPTLPAVDAPIGHVTNGVHARTWVGDRVDELLYRHARRRSGTDADGPSDWARSTSVDQLRRVWDIRNAGRLGTASRWSRDLARPTTCSTPTC